MILFIRQLKILNMHKKLQLNVEVKIITVIIDTKISSRKGHFKEKFCKINVCNHFLLFILIYIKKTE